jgi:hypothetical protein
MGQTSLRRLATPSRSLSILIQLLSSRVLRGLIMTHDATRENPDDVLDRLARASTLQAPVDRRTQAPMLR